MQATALAPSNLALVKYWGKRDEALNLPAAGSISVTLDGLESRTTVRFDEALATDTFVLDGRQDATALARVARFLDLVRALAGTRLKAAVASANSFPTGAGLASSASGFAALALACDAALGLGLSAPELSALARRGSGSAARSFAGGYAEMRVGEAADGSDAYAVGLGGPELLPMDILVVVTTMEAKTVGSTEGMLRTQRTSCCYEPWVARQPAVLADMREAVLAGDLSRVGALAEESCLSMHATMLSARPPLLYWNATTVDVMRRVWAARAQGREAWFTIDAGPQVKVLCPAGKGAPLGAELATVPGVERVIPSRPGLGARVLERAT